MTAPNPHRRQPIDGGTLAYSRVASAGWETRLRYFQASGIRPGQWISQRPGRARCIRCGDVVEHTWTTPPTTLPACWRCPDDIAALHPLPTPSEETP